jgi:DNA-binding transcriptional LysR family regulator
VNGLGLAYMMDSTVLSLLADKRLVRVLDAYCPPFPGYFLYYPSRSNIAPKLQALVDFLKKRRPGRGRRPNAATSRRADDRRPAT